MQHALYTFAEDCNNEFTNIGSYKVQNDSLIFMTEYKQKTGLDPIPLRQKQIYKVSATGRLTLVFDKVQKRFSGEWVDTKSAN